MHTPDPWRADPVYGGDSTWIMAHRLFRPDCGGSFCTIEHFGITGKRLPNAESTANVRLMVLAPEMLAALKALYAQCAMVHKHWGDGSNQQEASAAIAAGLSVIARATGEEA